MTIRLHGAMINPNFRAEYVMRVASIIAALWLGLLGPLSLSGGHAYASDTRKGYMLATLDHPVEEIQNHISSIATLGGDTVRFPVYFSREPRLAVWFDKIDAALRITESRNMTLVIDIHHPGPGEGSTITNPDDFVAKWEQIALRYRNHRARIWYDLCNEPQNSIRSWASVALRAANAIRRWDTRHAIVYAALGDTTNSARSFAKLPGITNQIIQFHFWDWSNGVQSWTRAIAPSPSWVRYPSGNYTKETLRTRLLAVRDAGIRNDVPVYIGEVGIPSNHPDAARFLRDFTAICDEFGIHLTVHAYRESWVWNYDGTRAGEILERWLRP